MESVVKSCRKRLYFSEAYATEFKGGGRILKKPKKYSNEGWIYRHSKWCRKRSGWGRLHEDGKITINRNVDRIQSAHGRVKNKHEAGHEKKPLIGGIAAFRRPVGKASLFNIAEDPVSPVPSSSSEQGLGVAVGSIDKRWRQDLHRVELFPAC
jgi:hypothetical protein